MAHVNLLKEFNKSLNAQIVAQNTQALETGKEIISSRNNVVGTAAATQALANQTGGNIMGFTYE